MAAYDPHDDPHDGAEEDYPACESEFIDGSYTDCGCPECAQMECQRIEESYEAGHLTEAEALEAHDMRGCCDEVEFQDEENAA